MGNVLSANYDTEVLKLRFPFSFITILFHVQKLNIESEYMNTYEDCPKFQGIQQVLKKTAQKSVFNGLAVACDIDLKGT